MKKIYTSLAMLALAASSAMAQQLPNVGFEGAWVESYPWNSVYNQLSMKDALKNMGDETTFCKQPEGWIVSNVLGVVSEKTDGTGYGALGTTVVADSVAGNNSKSALRLTNRPNPFMATQIVPAFVSFGKAWATNTLNFANFQVENKDGGVFGGLEFDKRPDALVFDYQRAYAEGAEAQNATVLVYAWKGTWTQENVPGNNAMGPATVTVTMTDRDRNILGMETAQGGAVTKSDDAELIAKSLQYIEGEAADWTNYVLPIEYLSDATPAKINVVLAANDYFDSENIVNGNSLTVDNVKFVYYSRLVSASFGGQAVEGFDADKYEYELAGEMPVTDDYKFELLGGGKSATVVAKPEGNTMTVTVTNNGEDLDGKAEHIYTFTWKGDAPAGDTVNYEGKLTIEMMGGLLTPEDGQDATIQITPTGDNSCNFVLPDFQLDLGTGPQSLGDIVVNEVKTTTADGTTSYDGFVQGLSLLGGSIIADVTVTGTTNENGDADMKIDVMWNNIPINVTFTGKKTTGVAGITANDNAPVEYFNLQGVRVANPESGLYIRRQGNKVTKVLVK